MSNPGPAVTTSIHPQNLASNQALRLIATAQAVNLNSLGDTQVNVIDVTSYVPVSVITANCNNAGSAVSTGSTYLGVYTAPAAAGTAILTKAALATNTTTANASVVAASLTTSATSAQQLYVNVSSAAVAGTIDVYVYGYDLSAQ
jgi:hypothetical protein